MDDKFSISSLLQTQSYWAHIALFLKSVLCFFRGRQLWVRLTEVFHPVWLWWDSELWHHTHSCRSPRSGQMPNAGLSLRLAAIVFGPLTHNSVCPFKKKKKINAPFHGRNVTSIVVVNLFLPLVPINLTCWSDHNIPAWFFTVLLNECHPQKRTSVWRSEGLTWGRTVSLLTVLLHTAEFGLGNTLTVH